MSTAAGSEKKSGGLVWRYVVIAAIATALLVGIKLIFEHTSWGYQNELWVFGKLQNSLAQIDLDNPVVVLDISGLPGGKPGDPTPRKDLEEIISALAGLQSPPRAIAVDINFSPKGPNYSAKEDEEFFDFCLSTATKQKVPVFLAVAETKAAPPEAWLGNEKYKTLAVAAAGDIEDTSRIPLWVESPYSSERLVTLSYALASEYRKRLPRANWWIRWATDERSEEAGSAIHHENKPIDDEATLAYEDRFVNYSKLDQMREAAHPDVKKDAIVRAAQKYSDRVVILGDLNSADKVPIPGRQIDQQGSLVLASAAYTLIKEPLFEFKWWIRILLDVAIAAAIIMAVARIRKKSSDDAVRRRQTLFVYAAVAVVLFVGWNLVSWAGILWLDFLLVAVALLLHPKAEHWVDQVVMKVAPEKSASEEAIPQSEPVTGPEASPAGAEKIAAAVTKTTAAGLVLLVTAMASGFQVSAQQSLSSLPRCEKAVAAIGVRLNRPPQKSKKKKIGTCYVRQNRDSAWEPLTASSVLRQYRAGEYLVCDGECSLTLLYCGTQTEKLVDTQKPDWFPVIHAFRPPPPLSDPKKNNLLRLSRSFSPPDPQTESERPLALFSDGRIVSYGIAWSGPRLGGGAPSVGIAATSKPPVKTGDKATERSDTRSSTTTSDSRARGETARINREIEDSYKTATPRYSPTPRPSVGDAIPLAPSSETSTGADLSATETEAAKEQKLLHDASVARGNKQYDIARQIYLDLQKVNPGDYRLSQGLGNLYADQETWTAAEQSYLEALKLKPSDTSLDLSLAFVMFQSMIAGGNNSRAQEVQKAIQQAIGTNRRNPEVYELLEQFFESQNTSPSDREPLLRAAVINMPDSVTAKLRLAQVLYRRGKTDEGLNFIRYAENLAFLSWHYVDMSLVAQSYQAYGRYKDAERVMKRALQLKPNDPVFLYNLGSVLVQRKHFEEAISPLQEASKLKPDEFAPVLVLGIAQLGAGKLAAAEISFDNASGRVHDDADGVQRLAYWYSELGDAYRSKGKSGDAVRAYEKSLKHVAENPDTRARLLEAQRKHKSKSP